MNTIITIEKNLRNADIHAHHDEALRWASQFGRLEIAKLLLEKNADVHADDDEALQDASRHGHLEIVKLLLEKMLMFMMKLYDGLLNMVI
jgi:ankyrin repeat protein